MLIVLICDCYIQLSMNYFSSMVKIDSKTIILYSTAFKQFRQLS